MSLLPQIMQDSNNLALEKCAVEAIKIDVSKIMIYPIEQTQEKLLPILAKEFHVLGAEGWNLCKNREQKNNLLTNSFQMHAQKGSIPSIIKALKVFGFEAEIEEFYEYQGRIGHFKIKFLNIYDRSLTPELEKELIELINCYKPATRHLDYINYFLCSKGFVFYSSRVKSVESVVIKTKGAVL